MNFKLMKRHFRPEMMIWYYYYFFYLSIPHVRFRAYFRLFFHRECLGWKMLFYYA